MIRVLLVDDQPTTRTGLRMLLELESDLSIVGEAGDGRDAIELAGTLRPDVVLMDIAMPILDGIAATAALGALAPRCAVVVLTLHDDDATRIRARDAGAVAVVGKHETDGVLVAAIRDAAPASRT